MHFRIGQRLIDIIKFNNNNIIKIIKLYCDYKNAVKYINDFPKYKIIFKFDDLINFDKKVRRLNKFLKQEGLKACLGIIGKSLENPDKNYIKFLKENNLKNYLFFNQGYLHLVGPEYEFFNKFLKKIGCEFIFPEDIGEKND